LLATAFVAAQAYAVTGTIGFSGLMQQKTAKGQTTNTFANPWSVIAGSQFGDYATVPDGLSPVTMGDFSFTGNNTASPVLSASVVQWQFDFGGKHYSFTLDTLTSAATHSGAIAETGTGTACIGTDCSDGTWSLDGTLKKGTKFTFNAAVHTSSAPDGGSTVALLGIALAGIETLRRKIAARKA
jgi:hypothetical protein